MPSDGLIVIAPVKAGAEEALRLILNRIGHDIRGRRMEAGLEEPRIDFPSSRTMHFARLALLEAPAAGPGRKRLLLVTDYEGSWEGHVAELLSLTNDPDAIWGCCEGYTDRDHFADFIRAHRVSPQAYYIALPGFTLDRIRELVQSRIQQDTWLPKLPGGSFVGKLLNMGADLTKFPLAGLDVLRLVWQHGIFDTLMAARQVNATLDRIWYIRLFNLLTLNSHPAPTHRYSQAPVDSEHFTPDPGDEVMYPSTWEDTPPEDLVSQNQLTLVTVVRPEQVRRLQAVLGVIDLYGRRLADPGSLVGISTIHTVRWALFDGDRRLLLASNYDGPWENYIDEFAELILSGLDAIWSSSLGYPAAGAQDVEALKHFLRSHQIPANVFYSAIPQATLLNIVDALALEPQPIPEPAPATQPALQGAGA